jgi:hypothetical protein
VGPEAFSVAYADIREKQFPGLPEMYHALYRRGIEVKLREGEVLSWLVESYFNRTWERFCSHRQTPPKPERSDRPFIVQNGNVITVTHPLFADYAHNGCKIHKDVLGHLMDRLIAPVVVSNLPSTAEVTLRALGDTIVLHVLHYVPMKRCKVIETIEDVFPLRDVRIAFRSERTPASARLVPSGEAVKFGYEDGYAHVHIPEINGHQMVEFGF